MITTKIERTYFKPFDLVKNIKTGDYGMVTEISNEDASIDWFGDCDLFNAWWNTNEVEIIDNVMMKIANVMQNPRPGKKRDQGYRFFEN